MGKICDGKIMKYMLGMKPDFRLMTDEDLIGLVGWCEEWSAIDVYDTAFAQVFPVKQLDDAKPDFERWIQFENPQLPVIVREELMRASEIHFNKGSMIPLAWANMASKILRVRWLFYIFAAIVIGKWLL